MIPTAKELFGFMLREDADVSYEEAMIQFARFHVKEALKQASENAEIVDKYFHDVEIDKDSILNAYPLDNIK